MGRRGWAELAGELAAGLAEELGAELTGELMGELATELAAEPAGGECVSLAPGAVVRIRPGSLSSLTELEGLGGAVVVEHRGRWRVRMVGEDAGDRDLRSFRLECLECLEVRDGRGQWRPAAESAGRGPGGRRAGLTESVRAPRRTSAWSRVQPHSAYGGGPLCGGLASDVSVAVACL